MVPEQRRWSAAQSHDLYNLDGWGQPYFAIDRAGHLRVSPQGADGPDTRLTKVVDMARRQGMSLPLLVRFDGILGHRVRTLVGAFTAAIDEAGFGGRYRPVYPIKVNQQRHVVEELIDAGRGQGLGLEVGSKPELMAVVALLESPSLIICNGYKDETYLEMATLAVRLGHEVVVVIEKPSEIETIGRVVQREGAEAMPSLGLRARLAARGEGRWKSSAGDRAKFGLSAAQLVGAVEWLRELGLEQRVRLLHFHIGSQITAIRPWKAALREGTRLYVELARMGCPMGLFDVGGGLAVDYDGSQTNFASSRNYTEQEYANDVVWAIHEGCDKAGLAPPDIITETGRALSAHHSMMVVEVTGTSRLSVDGPLPEPADDEHELVTSLRDNLASLSEKRAVEVFHDAQSLREEMLQRFGLGLVDLPTRAACEHLVYATLERVASLAADLEHAPEELVSLPVALADTYFCNFSVFQSAPDSWAIGQIFPVLPIHRLHEEPTVRAVLGDLTCDSDGRIDRFPGARETKRALELHPLREGERYLLGIFLVGAYQEILGDLHNLFGDTDTVHVDFDVNGQPFLVDRIHGEPVSKVLGYVGYDERWMQERFDRALERLVRAGELTGEEAGQVRADLRAGLAGNTYLTEREVEEVREADLAADEDEPVTPVVGPEAELGRRGGDSLRVTGAASRDALDASLNGETPGDGTTTAAGDV